MNNIRVGSLVCSKDSIHLQSVHNNRKFIKVISSDVLIVLECKIVPETIDGEIKTYQVVFLHNNEKLKLFFLVSKFFPLEEAINIHFQPWNSNENDILP